MAGPSSKQVDCPLLGMSQARLPTRQGLSTAHGWKFWQGAQAPAWQFMPGAQPMGSGLGPVSRQVAPPAPPPPQRTPRSQVLVGVQLCPSPGQAPPLPPDAPLPPAPPPPEAAFP